MRSKVFRLHVALGAAAVTVAACGSATSPPGLAAKGRVTVPESSVPYGGTLIDGAQLASSDNLTSYDPGLVTSVNQAEVTAAVFQGLTAFDYTDPIHPVLKGLSASKWTSNSTATQYTFTIRKGLEFSNGDPVLPSSFKYAWERNGSKQLASDYGYLIDYVKGGADLQDGKVSTLPAIVADDNAMTLTVTLDHPESDFAEIVTHQFFFPLPERVLRAYGAKHHGDTSNWSRDEVMIGNGPFKLAAIPNDQQVVLVRNPNWSGDIHGDTRPHLDKIVFKVSKDDTSAYTAFKAGDVDTGPIPAGSDAEALRNYANDASVPQLGVAYFQFGWTDKQLSGPKNLKLRQAISLAIDRQQIVEKLSQGREVPATGLVPPGIPGYAPGLCDYCTYDPQRAKQLIAEWKQAGGTTSTPIAIDYNTGYGVENLVAIVENDLQAIGLKVKANPVSENYDDVMVKGGCHLCRTAWFADYPTYGNFTFDLFSTDSVGGNNEGSFSDPHFDDLLTTALGDTNTTRQADEYHAAERYLLNTVTAAVPLYWYRGSTVFSPKVLNYDVNPLGIVDWARVGVKK